MFNEDFRAMEVCEDAYQLVQDANGDLYNVLIDSGLRSQFSAVDVNYVKVFDIMEGNPAPPTQIDDKEKPWVCHLRDCDGMLCGKAFSTKQALLCHQRISDIHEATISTRSIVVANQCPWCLTVFSTCDTARHHVSCSRITNATYVHITPAITVI